MREIVSVAFRNLSHQGIRSMLTLLGVIIGIASIFALISIGGGLQKAATDQFEQLGSNTIFIVPGGTFGGGGAQSSVRFCRSSPRTGFRFFSGKPNRRFFPFFCRCSGRRPW